jgi:hypothetical protein
VQAATAAYVPSAVLPTSLAWQKQRENVHIWVRQNKHYAKSKHLALTQCTSLHTWLHAISSQFQLTDCCEGPTGEVNFCMYTTGCSSCTARGRAVSCERKWVKGAATTLGWSSAEDHFSSFEPADCKEGTPRGRKKKTLLWHQMHRK